MTKIPVYLRQAVRRVDCILAIIWPMVFVVWALESLAFLGIGPTNLIRKVAGR